MAAVRGFVASIAPHIGSLSPSEIYCVFQQSGLLTSNSKAVGFAAALTTGRFPHEEIEKFVDGQPSLVDRFLDDKDLTLEAIETDAADALGDIREDRASVDGELPTVETKDVLASLDHHVIANADEEAVKFLLASAQAKLWKHAFTAEADAVAQAESHTGDTYAESVRKTFLDEYRAAKALDVPAGYAFRVNGTIAPPNLMQRLAASQVARQRRVGNWSGTGAGKTLSAILASRVVGAGLTVICCPNAVVDNWAANIHAIYPDSAVATKTWSPTWPKRGGHRYLVMNYESFQQANSASKMRALLESATIDFVVIDEVHYAKQRGVTASRRKENVTALVAHAGEQNPNLCVLGMSATPVINNLQEGRSLVEMITSLEFDDLETTPTINNCMKLHQELVKLGIRWMPDYDPQYDERHVEVDCSHALDDVRALGPKSTFLELERVLTEARLPTILGNIAPGEKTLIYTHYVEGITDLLDEALTAAGHTVGLYTGEDKSGLSRFLNGDVNVLVGSSAIGTGVDGLQTVCDKIIINILPWTAAEFEQLKGRVYRQGQRSDKVTLIIPVTHAEVNGERWSWCGSKLKRLQFKKSIADAAVDGVVPEGHLRSPDQAYKDVMAWLRRLDTEGVETIQRSRIVIPLPDEDPEQTVRRYTRYGEFSTMNRRWNQTRSENTHQRLQDDPGEWTHYHALYREARKTWEVVPFEFLVDWFRQRTRVHYQIGDFGSGEAKLAEGLEGLHTVHSFDHIAINNHVTACDMSNVPLDDGALDVAVFSLSLMGSNFTDYIREAHRCLRAPLQIGQAQAQRDVRSSAKMSPLAEVLAESRYWADDQAEIGAVSAFLDSKVTLRASECANFIFLSAAIERCAGSG